MSSQWLRAKPQVVSVAGTSTLTPGTRKTSRDKPVIPKVKNSVRCVTRLWYLVSERRQRRKYGDLALALPQVAVLVQWVNAHS